MSLRGGGPQPRSLWSSDACHHGHQHLLPGKCAPLGPSPLKHKAGDRFPTELEASPAGRPLHPCETKSQEKVSWTQRPRAGSVLVPHGRGGDRASTWQGLTGNSGRQGTGGS